MFDFELLQLKTTEKKTSFIHIKEPIQVSNPQIACVYIRVLHGYVLAREGIYSDEMCMGIRVIQNVIQVQVHEQARTPKNHTRSVL